VNSVIDIIAMFIGTAIIPPLVEEFAMRNVVMQPLRKYGNLFAIICSALVFGIFHGTPSQIPFAILCGLFLGYAVIATDSIWTGVIIHAIVNGLSCCYYAILYFTDEETADTAHGIVCLALAGLGFVALLIYISKYKTEFNRVISKKGLEEYTLKQKISKFIFAPAMIIAIIVFLIQAISMISYGTGVTA
jgi:membrane protease YdiL (CAAX protease family)